jgi:tRNA pseudouridine32 synthase/23S rRNA pseudouridine746 synthase
MMISKVYLPKAEFLTVFEFLVARFPHVPRSVWEDRISRGAVTLSDGRVVGEDLPYRHGLTVFYDKGVVGVEARRRVFDGLTTPAAPAGAATPPFAGSGVGLLVADKPHGIPVTPAGVWIEDCLLALLRKETGNEALTPMHRLDRDTAGLVLFSTDPENRGRYQQMFAANKIRREYLAVARVEHAPQQREWHVENRLGEGEPWFRRRVIDGPANAVTRISLLDVCEGLGLFRLLPQTGKKHQLRVHMAGLSFPILGDLLYGAPNADIPLQLLARSLEFDGRTFTSERSLQAWKYQSPEPALL